jgi:hypothetical protein
MRWRVAGSLSLKFFEEYVTFTVEGLLGMGKNDGEFAKNSA